MSKNFVDADTLAARNFVVPQIELLNPARRELMARTAMLGFGLAGAAMLGACHSSNSDSTPVTTPATPIGDADILNFALNLEYLEAEFYLRGLTGNGLAANMITGTGTQGSVTGGGQVTFTTTLGRQYAKEIAHDEATHVAFLRSALGTAAVARPAIDIQNSFTALFQAAGIIGSTETFNPYGSENNFLLAAFVFEDVGVTAYKGAAKLIANKTYLEAAAGILAAEAYHAGLLRTVLYARGYDMTVAGYDGSLIGKVTMLAAARDSVDGTTTTATTPGGATVANDDQGIAVSGTAPNDSSNIVPTDANGLAYSRNADKVLNVVYLTANAVTAGGFFPGRCQRPDQRQHLRLDLSARRIPSSGPFS